MGMFHVFEICIDVGGQTLVVPDLGIGKCPNFGGDQDEHK